MSPSNANTVTAREADPDSDVLGLVANHDMTGALRCLMQRHGTSVYRYCREALRDAALAEDVQQQVFIAAFRDLPKFSRRSTLRTWLFAIARHRVLDAAKSRRRARSHVDGEDASDVADPAPSPGECLDDVRLHEALVGCLEKLRPHVITALLLRFQQGFTFEDMANMCDEKPGTLQAQVTRALPVLRACIERRTGGTL
jgi:RNA polymerase sigma-70 factor (ECF subfamily)